MAMDVWNERWFAEFALSTKNTTYMELVTWNGYGGECYFRYGGPWDGFDNHPINNSLVLPLVRPKISMIQTALNSFAAIKGGARLTVDGMYGPATEAGVDAYQRRYGLYADGLTGGATWESLRRNFG